MARWREWLSNERGLALPLALMALVVLLVLVMTFLNLGGVEPRIAQNLNEGTRARYVAEAGIEFGFNQLAGTTNWSGLLAANGGVLANNQALPSQPAAAGTFTVSIRNDNQPGDTALTGVPLDPGNNTTDNNATVIMTAVGRVGTAVRRITVVASRAQLPVIPAALGFPGLQADVAFSGSAFTITGNDTNMDDTPGTGPPVLGISVSPVYPLTNPGANEGVVEAALAANQKARVTGRPEGAGPGVGNNTIDVDGALTPQAIASFLNTVKPLADITIRSTQASPYAVNNIGASCSSDPTSPTCWGTPSKPKIIYIKGDPDPTSMFTALAISGNSSGTGILIVEDGDLRITGNFNWNGLIIVTGQYVGVGFLGGGNQSVYGAVISNEMVDEQPGFREGVVTGNAKLKYSKQALDLVRNMRKLVRLYSWREE